MTCVHSISCPQFLVTLYDPPMSSELTLTPKNEPHILGCLVLFGAPELFVLTENRPPKSVGQPLNYPCSIACENDWGGVALWKCPGAVVLALSAPASPTSVVGLLPAASRLNVAAGISMTASSNSRSTLSNPSTPGPLCSSLWQNLKIFGGRVNPF